MRVLAAVAGIGQSDCERVVSGTLAQPVLAITSLAYVVVGLAVLCWAVRVRGVLAAAAGIVLIAVGVGSFAYHGPQPSWAGLAHDWPIVALASGVRRGSGTDCPTASADVVGGGRNLRDRSNRLHRRSFRVAAVPAGQPVAVPRRLACSFRSRRGMRRLGDGAPT